MTEGGSNLDGLNDFWFVLLTPGMFRTEEYGGPVNTPLDCFMPCKSRFYCYKMNDYKDPNLLRLDLLHWQNTLKDKYWKLISGRISWLTFEDIVAKVLASSLLPTQQRELFRRFFEERGLVAKGIL